MADSVCLPIASPHPSRFSFPSPRARRRLGVLALLLALCPLLQALDGLTLFRLAEAKYKAKDWDKSIAYFEQAIRKADEEGPGSRNLKALSLSLMGDAWKAKGEGAKGLGLWKEALAIAVSASPPETVAAIRGKIGDHYLAAGRVSEALPELEASLEAALSASNLEAAVLARVRLSEAWLGLGLRDRALAELEAARAVSATIHTRPKGGVAIVEGKAVDAGYYSPYCHGIVLERLGTFYRVGEDYEKAFAFYDEAASLFGRIGAWADSAGALMRIALIRSRGPEPRKALSYLELAKKAFERAKDPEGLAGVDSALGSVRMRLGEYEEAGERIKAALDAYLALGRKDAALEQYTGLGICSWARGRREEAELWFARSVEESERVRASVPPEYRREYLAGILSVYDWRSLNALEAGDVRTAFAMGETSRARVLSEAMRAGADLGAATPSVSPSMSPEEVQARLGPGEAALAYTAMKGFTKAAVLVLTREAMAAKEIDKVAAYAASASEVPPRDLEAFYASLPGLAFDPPSGAMSDPRAGDWEDILDRLVAYYRSLLEKPRLDAKERRALAAVGRTLYTLLIKPAEAELAGKDSLLIVPAGSIAYLPFEALPLPDGRWLVEKYNVRYAQSFAVAALCQDRAYPPDRRPLLGFGGAVYDAASYAKDITESSAEIEAFVAETLAALNRGGSALDAYGALGRGRISNLPGTLAEVEAIARIVPGAEVRTGRAADEGIVKGLSASGALAGYRVLHFATHGMVVPEMPELSAVILTVKDPAKEGDDGFLRAGEIRGLALRSDLVNLSACQTGLGKIFDGEGVVGLLQSFLIAGSRSVSASLWPVADESTMVFMSAFYKAAARPSDYARAFSSVKRRFISGELGGGAWRAPVFWAPFVFYGP